MIKKCFDNWFAQNHAKFYLTLKKYQNQLFSNLGQLGTKSSKTFKKYKINKHIPVLDIAKNKSALISGIAEIRP